MTAVPVIETIALAKRFGRKTALADLTMTVRAGEAFGFLGPNGAGKTTAIKVLLGLTRATSGAGELLGAPLGDREARRRIGYLPELFRYPAWLTAREVLAFHARLIGMPRAGRETKIDDALAIVGLSNEAHNRAGTFSKGMQQRLGIGVAILGDPDVVFLDEPTSALDPRGRHDVRGIIETLRHRGAAVFLNSHLLTEVERTCDHVAFVEKGRVIAAGSVDEILGTSRSLRVRLENVSDSVLCALRSAGDCTADPPWFELAAIEPERVPDVVRALVEAGASVHAVEPSRETLEERYLQLLAAPP